jgi:hypothetical protein
LTILTNRCKASLNGSFSAWGYGTVPSGCDDGKSLTKIFPHLARNYQELRQWTVRKKVSSTPSIKPNQLVSESVSTATPVQTLDGLAPPPNYAALDDADRFGFAPFREDSGNEARETDFDSEGLGDTYPFELFRTFAESDRDVFGSWNSKQL